MTPPTSPTAAGVRALAALRADPAAALIACDFDGTLAPIVAEPADARAHPDAGAALRELAAVVGAVAVVTGRPPAFAASNLGLDVAMPANLIVLGHYGAQRWAASENRALIAQPTAATVSSAVPPAAAIEALRRELPAVIEEFRRGSAGRLDGVTLEDKVEAVAVHTRGAVDPPYAYEVLRGPLAELAQARGLRLEPGRLVLELRLPGVDKGSALEALVAECRARWVAFVGDDLGDLAAFDALDRMRARGLTTLAVCSASDEVPEITARADVVLAGPAAVVVWMREVAAAIRA